MFRAIQLGLCVAALLVMPAIVCADSIPWLVDTNTNAVIFDDSFESPLGVLGNAPVATAGTWSLPGVTAQVTDAATAGFAANEGSQFLQVNRNGSQEMFGMGVAANSGTGHDIMLTMAFRAGAGADGNFGVLSGSSTTADLLLNGNGTLSYLLSGTGWVPLTQTYSLTAWNTVVITHTNGTNVYELSVNGATPESVGQIAGVSNADGVYGASAGNGAIPMYFDSVAVPEPSTVAIVLTGLIGLLAYAWKKRR